MCLRITIFLVFRGQTKCLISKALPQFAVLLDSEQHQNEFENSSDSILGSRCCHSVSGEA